MHYLLSTCPPVHLSACHAPALVTIIPLRAVYSAEMEPIRKVNRLAFPLPFLSFFPLPLSLSLCVPVFPPSLGISGCIPSSEVVPSESSTLIRRLLFLAPSRRDFVRPCAPPRNYHPFPFPLHPPPISNLNHINRHGSSAPRLFQNVNLPAVIKPSLIKL